MLQELEQKARHLAPFLWISLAEEPDTAKSKICGILERIKSQWCLFPKYAKCQTYQFYSQEDVIRDSWAVIKA